MASRNILARIGELAIIVIGASCFEVEVCGQVAAPLQLVLTNPATTGQLFGWSVATIGHENLLIGAPGGPSTQAAYLYSTNGTLIATFTNPIPNPNVIPAFGTSVNVLDTNTILIGSPAVNASGYAGGAAYVFKRDGALITAITNTADLFGQVILPVGQDKLLIGAERTAYVFSTNGTHLHTFTNLASGRNLAVVNSNCVLIGSPSAMTNQWGVGRMYDINGGLIRTFNAPGFDPRFGWAVAILRSNVIAISGANAVSLFELNGTLLMTLSNPAPQEFASFGGVIMGLANDRVLVSAGDTNGNSAVCLFNYEGKLLNVFTNPISTREDWFGISIAPVGANTVLIGAPMNNTGRAAAGVALVFEVDKPPDLKIGRGATNTVVISWPRLSSGWLLQAKDDLSSGWIDVTETRVNEAFIISPTGPSRFFRLVPK